MGGLLLSDARILAAYLIFFGSYFVFALRIGLPVTLATLAVGTAWLWIVAR